MNRCVLLLILLLCAISTSADAGRRRVNPDVVEDALAFATTDRAKALLLLEQAIEGPEAPNDLVLLYLHLAEQHRLSGHDVEAHDYFTKVVAHSPTDPDLNAARLGLALLEAKKSNSSNVLSMMESISEKDALATQNADRFLILTFYEHDAQNTSKSAAYKRKCLSYAEQDPGVLRRVTIKLAMLDTPPDEREEPVAEPETEKSTSKLERAEAAFASQRMEVAQELAEQILQEGDDTEKLIAKYLIRRIEADAPLDENLIAVLLPLSGKYEAVGSQLKEALAIGYGTNRRQLSFVDTGATAETAVQALEKVVLEDGAIAVVGPLLTDETEPVVQAAQAMRVPLVSLSQALDSTDGMDWVFQGMVNIPAQVSALLDHVMGHLEMRSFAIFAPDSPYGQRATANFT
ncbi:MAG: ABC transporter substrate-binding protein, partial [Proteobacteria bacterium]|nr:ABC transporter substrate-binding protein [Pseudomonadota bacterium]